MHLKVNSSGGYLTINGLLWQLEEFLEFKELVKYRVTENFEKGGKHSYIIHNLIGECFDTGFGVLILFDDLEHKMGQGYKVLKILNINSIQTIECAWNQGKKCKFDLYFDDGKISIEKE